MTRDAILTELRELNSELAWALAAGHCSEGETAERYGRRADRAMDRIEQLADLDPSITLDEVERRH